MTPICLRDFRRKHWSYFGAYLESARKRTAHQNWLLRLTPFGLAGRTWKSTVDSNGWNRKLFGSLRFSAAYLPKVSFSSEAEIQTETLAAPKSACERSRPVA